MRALLTLFCCLAGAAFTPPLVEGGVERNVIQSRIITGSCVGRAITQGEAYALASAKVPLGAVVYRREVTEYSGGITSWVYRLYWKLEK